MPAKLPVPGRKRQRWTISLEISTHKIENMILSLSPWLGQMGDSLQLHPRSPGGVLGGLRSVFLDAHLHSTSFQVLLISYSSTARATCITWGFTLHLLLNRAGSKGGQFRKSTNYLWVRILWLLQNTTVWWNTPEWYSEMLQREFTHIHCPFSPVSKTDVRKIIRF